VIIAGLVFAGCQVLVFGCFALLAVRFYRRERARVGQEIAAALTEFATSPDKDTPSPLAVIIDQAALLLAARLMQQLKAMMAGVESGASKGEQASMIAEATSGSPWLALLSGILPARIRNQLMKNPQMIGALSKLGGNHSPSSSSAQSTFDL